MNIKDFTLTRLCTRNKKVLQRRVLVKNTQNIKVLKNLVDSTSLVNARRINPEPINVNEKAKTVETQKNKKGVVYFEGKNNWSNRSYILRISQFNWSKKLDVFEFEPGEKIWNLGKMFAQFEDLKSSNLSRFERMREVNILRSARKCHRATQSSVGQRSPQYELSPEKNLAPVVYHMDKKPAPWKNYVIDHPG